MLASFTFNMEELMDTPSELFLLNNVDLDPNYNYTIDFDNLQAQENYFDAKISNALSINDDYSYIVPNEPIKVYKNVDDLFGVNYLYYNNGGKRYYAFITNKEYISATCTAITFKIDVYQTFMFDYSLDESFIEREHQDRYTQELKPIYNLESEQLEKGSEYIVKDRVKIYDNLNDEFFNKYKDNVNPDDASNGFIMLWATIVCKEHIAKQRLSGTSISTNVNDAPTNVNGMITNSYTYVAPLPILFGTWATNISYPQFYLSTYGSVIMALDNESRGGAFNPTKYGCMTASQLIELSQDPNVISINVSRYCPFNVLFDKRPYTDGIFRGNLYIFYPSSTQILDGINATATKYDNEHDNYYAGAFYIASPNTTTTPTKTLGIGKKTSLDNTPSIADLKNENLEPKLLTSDYTYYEVTFGQVTNKLNVCDFENMISFYLMSSYSINNTTTIIPHNYQGVDKSVKDLISFDSTLNEIPLRTDAWLQYLSQNKAQLITGFITDTLKTGASIGLGIATGGMGLAVAGSQAINFAGNIANKVAQINDIKNTPDEVKKASTDVVNEFLVNDLYITITTREIRPQFRHKIFEYFYHYGYKCNDFKTPNIRSRYYFNYIKTIGANIKTNIDSVYRDELQRIYDAGVTIWHYRNASTFKGVNNYKYENVEINLMEVQNG